MSKMKKIPVEELRPGMIYDKPIYVDSNNILIMANAPIKESDIKKLTTWGITAVETAGVLLKMIDVANEKTPPSDSESEKKIVSEYNDLLKKRKTLIEIHSRARAAV